MKQVIPVPDAPKPAGQYSHAVRAGNTLYISGQVGLDPVSGTIVEGGIEPQTRQVMKNLETALTAAGLEFKHVVKSYVYVDDIANMPTVNGIYAEAFPTDPPARTSIEVAALPLGAMIEIGMIAVFE